MIKLQRTIFARLLIFNLAFIVAATLVTQVIYYNYFNHKYIQESIRNNLLLVEQVRRSIDERILEKTLSIPVIYLYRSPSNYNLVYPMDHDISQESAAILKVSRRLNELKNSYEFIHSVDLYYPYQHLIFINSTVCFLSDANFTRQYLPVWLAKYQKKVRQKAYWLPLHNTRINNEEIVTYVYQTPQGGAVIGINIKREFLQRLLATMKLDPQGLFWIFDGSGKMVVNEGNATPPYRIRTKIVGRILSMGNAGMFTAAVGGVSFVISFSKSIHNNWRYISLIPTGRFYEKSRQVMFVAILIGGALLLINLLGMIAITKKAHQPLAPVLQTVGSLAAKFGGVSENRDEYQMLNVTLDTLAGRIEGLTRRLDENKPVIKHNLIAALLDGRIGYEQWRKNYRQIYGQELDGELFSCFLIRLKCNLAKQNPDFHSMMLVAYNLIDILEQQEAPWDIRAIAGDDYQSVIGIISHSKGLKRPEIFKKIAIAIETIYHGRYQLALGNACQPIGDQVALAFQQAQTTLRYGFLFPKLKFLDYQRIQPENLRPTGNFHRAIAKITVLLRAGSLKELKLAIHQLFVALVKDGYQIDICRNTIGDLISILYNTTTEMGLDPAMILGSDPRVTWKELSDALAVKKWLEGCVTQILAAVKERREKTDDSLEMKIKKFIINNITNELSLEKVADALHIYYYTLSRTFKSITGLSFVEYVKDLKMQIAANLLCEAKLSVKEISNRLGYHSVPYFIRVFKTKYGMTPKEFQRNNRL
jgi:AraC-like DNA-binding protein